MTDLRGIGVTTLGPLSRRPPKQHRSIQIVLPEPGLVAQPAKDRGADHDLASVRTLAQYIYVMKSGGLAEEGARWRS